MLFFSFLHLGLNRDGLADDRLRLLEHGRLRYLGLFCGLRLLYGGALYLAFEAGGDDDYLHLVVKVAVEVGAPDNVRVGVSLV